MKSISLLAIIFSFSAGFLMAPEIIGKRRLESLSIKTKNLLDRLLLRFKTIKITHKTRWSFFILLPLCAIQFALVYYYIISFFRNDKTGIAVFLLAGILMHAFLWDKEIVKFIQFKNVRWYNVIIRIIKGLIIYCLSYAFTIFFGNIILTILFPIAFFFFGSFYLLSALSAYLTGHDRFRIVLLVLGILLYILSHLFQILITVNSKT